MNGGRWYIVLGDQLDTQSAVFADFDPARDAIWMCESSAEATEVWSHKQRIAVFLSAMRHVAQRFEAVGRRVIYHELSETGDRGLGEQLARDIEASPPAELVVAQPGEWRIEQMLRDVAEAAQIKLTIRDDSHFLVTPAEFAQWARWEGERPGKQLRMETFYRWMRKRHDVLMGADGPAGGKWNLDADNRASFGRDGPGQIPARYRAQTDATTDEVMALVATRFADHPGSLDDFAWPVTPDQAQRALDRFIEHKLAQFGDVQDAMWSGEPWLFHSQLSVALNLKLIDPMRCIDAAEEAWRDGRAPLNAVEGFVRQILGWREYVRGVYFNAMPGLAQSNALDAAQPLPALYWTGDTDMACLSSAVGETLATGYAHHIQRLMVTGLFALLLGVRPSEIHAWYLAIYVDAVEWVELPNTIGMSQFADGGLLASKPYVATGKYIDRMSNHCATCRFRPDRRTGEAACPFTTLYWDFLDRHADRFADHHRMRMQLRNLERLSADERQAIRSWAEVLRTRLRDDAL